MNNQTSHEKAIQDIDRILGILEQDEPIKHVKSKERQYWENQVDMLALSEGKQMVLTSTGWIGNITVANRWGAEIIYSSAIVGVVNIASVGANDGDGGNSNDKG